MCRLVIGTPGSDRIPNMSASKLDLGIIAHDVGLCFGRGFSSGEKRSFGVRGGRGGERPSSRTTDGVEKIEGSTILIKGQAVDVCFKVT